jgi:hypothetical protein
MPGASSELRKRHTNTDKSTDTDTDAATSTSMDDESVTSLPVFMANGDPVTERTPLPTMPTLTSPHGDPVDSTGTATYPSTEKTLQHHQFIDSPSSTSGPRKAMSADQVQQDESKLKKVMVRVVFGFCMFGVFSGSVYMGHLYICLLVAAIEMLLFRELVRVRYSAYFQTIQNTIPLFRTTQWVSP